MLDFKSNKHNRPAAAISVGIGISALLILVGNNFEFDLRFWPFNANPSLGNFTLVIFLVAADAIYSYSHRDENPRHTLLVTMFGIALSCVLAAYCLTGLEFNDIVDPTIITRALTSFYFITFFGLLYALQIKRRNTAQYVLPFLLSLLCVLALGYMTAPFNVFLDVSISKLALLSAVSLTSVFLVFK